MGQLEQTLGAATSVRTAELCRNARLSTGTEPPSSSRQTPTFLPIKWNTSALSPQPSSSSPPWSLPCPTRKWPSLVALEGPPLHQQLHQQELHQHRLHQRLHLALSSEATSRRHSWLE